MKPLSFHAIHLIRAAEGWLALGNLAEAQAELRQLDAEDRDQPAAMDAQWSVHAAAGDWGDAHACASAMIARYPGLVGGWIHRAYAARRMAAGGLKAACEALLPAAELFPKEPNVPFNLACYMVQMGALDEGWRWYQEAVRRGDRKLVQKQALADEDLRLLWPRISSGGAQGA